VQTEQSEKYGAVAVLGASPKLDRYAYKAMQLLAEYGYRAIPFNPAFPEILGQKSYPSIIDVPDKIDTVTLYLRKTRSDPLIDEIVEVRPRRIVMNPGAANFEVTAKARERGIEVVEGCTLVMLRSGQF
jgi:predicted CoA-binding protein